MENKHGGSRPVTRKDDGRLAKKPRKPASEKYRQYPLKLPPDLINWLRDIDNRNGFIVEAIREKIAKLNKTK